MTREQDENYRKKLIYRSWHRGTKEMDLLMGSFADQYIEDFSTQEVKQYEEILSHNDPDLYNWITGQEQLPANLRNAVMQRLLKHRYDKNFSRS